MRLTGTRYSFECAWMSRAISFFPLFQRSGNCLTFTYEKDDVAIVYTAGRSPNSTTFKRPRDQGSIEITRKIAYSEAMKIANIAELKNRLSEFLALVEQGEEIEIRKRNIAIARVIPLRRKRPNATRLGSGAGTVRIRGDLTEPLIPESDWGMLRRSRR